MCNRTLVIFELHNAILTGNDARFQNFSYCPVKIIVYILTVYTLYLFKLTKRRKMSVYICVYNVLILLEMTGPSR